MLPTRWTPLYVLLDGDDVVGLEVDDGLCPGPAAVAVAQVVVAEDHGVLVGGQEPGQVAVVLVQVLCAVV